MGGLTPNVLGLQAPPQQQFTGASTPMLQPAGASPEIQQPLNWSAGPFGPFPTPLINHELPEEKQHQVQTLLAELQEKFNSSDTKFTEDKVIATARTYKLIQEIYHSNARLAGEEGLLVDTGAVQNLTGDSWTSRMEQRLPEGRVRQ